MATPGPIAAAPAGTTAAGTSCGRRIVPVLLLLLFIYGAAVWGWSMHRDYNHDEHQFLAPGALFAQEGLLPFRDYPLFHLPNLTLVYGYLARWTGYPLLSAKLVSICATWMVGMALVMVVYRNPPAGNRRWILPAAGLALGLLFLDPLFTYTVGKTWNHELPTFLTLMATVLVIEAGRRDAMLLSAAAGLLAGLAAGTRLTFAPVLCPLFVAHLFFPGTIRRRIGMAVAFGGMALVGLAPSLWLMGTAPEQFVFGNLKFPRLAATDPDNTRVQKTLNPVRKVRYFFKEIVLPSWPVFVAYLMVGIGPAIAWLRTRQQKYFAPAVASAVLLTLIVGAFAPSRYQYQHHYVEIPMLLLAAAYGVACMQGGPADRRIWQWAWLLVAVGAILGYWRERGREKDAFTWVPQTVQPSQWFPMTAHKTAMEFRRYIGPGRVLTLAPAWVTEAGVPIYPEFATGPFAWRNARLMDPAKRERMRMVAPDDLEKFLANQPPAAVLLNVEDEKLEAPIREWAQKHGYEAVQKSKKRELWVPPTKP